jgi:glycosyltransferase involved in cell wall biosynthesis
MKICFVCNEYPPMPCGGIGVFVKTLAEALAQEGVDVHVLGYGRKQAEPTVINGVKVHWIWLPNPLYKKITLGGYPYSIAAMIKRHYLSLMLKRLARQEKIDLVESYDFSGPLAFKPPCPLVMRLHGSVLVCRHGEGRPTQIAPLDKHFEIKNVRMADHIVAVSRHIGEATNQVMHLNKEFQVIYNGVDVQKFLPQPIQSDAKTILFIGNLMWRKGVFDLIKAMPKVLRSHPDAVLKIVGGSSGGHQAQLEKALLEVGETTRSQIELVGKVPHVQLPGVINEASVFVFPSRVEAFGLTCAEAMACGRPIVATNLASGPELIEDGISGLLADPSNPDDLAEKICKLLDDPILAANLGVAARERAVQEFNLHTNLNLNLEYYKSLL